MRLINADALRMKLSSDTFFNNMDDLTTVRYAIDKAPTIEVAPVVRGEWLIKILPDGHAANGLVCSACKRGLGYTPDYCPNCGAKMKEGVKRDTQTDL